MPNTKSSIIRTRNRNLYLRVLKGHFATSHSHVNYFIDVTSQKTRLSEARAVAKELASYYTASTAVDTILCLDGTQVIGTCLAIELASGDFMNINANKNICIVTPEHTSGSQLIFRDNVSAMIDGKRVLILAASVSTGYTAKSAVEAISYYGGYVAGICSLFATTDNYAGYEVRSIFDPNDLKDFESYQSHECPLCKEGKKIDALVNSFGYSKL